MPKSFAISMRIIILRPIHTLYLATATDRKPSKIEGVQFRRNGRTALSGNTDYFVMRALHAVIASHANSYAGISLRK
jgi:hypothetical protein